MHSASRWVVALAVGVAVAAGFSTVSAADLAGTWQGTLTVGQALRLVFTIAPVSGGSASGTMRSLDQGGPALAVSEITLQGNAVRMAIPGIGGTFEGRLSQDEKSVAGTWSQGGMSWPLTLTRATADTAWTIPPPSAQFAPMAASAPTTFEVATIRPSRPETQGKGITMRGRQVVTINTAAAGGNATLLSEDG